MRKVLTLAVLVLIGAVSVKSHSHANEMKAVGESMMYAAYKAALAPEFERIKKAHVHHSGKTHSHKGKKTEVKPTLRQEAAVEVFETVADYFDAMPQIIEEAALEVESHDD